MRNRPTTQKEVVHGTIALDSMSCTLQGSLQDWDGKHTISLLHLFLLYFGMEEWKIAKPQE